MKLCPITKSQCKECILYRGRHCIVCTNLLTPEEEFKCMEDIVNSIMYTEIDYEKIFIV